MPPLRLGYLGVFARDPVRGELAVGCTEPAAPLVGLEGITISVGDMGRMKDPCLLDRQLPALWGRPLGEVMRNLDKPVHLYVKTHNLTGLRYFGRTTDNPYDYRGSGAYWTRHLEMYGNNVSTKVIGTYTDSRELRAAAKAFSDEHHLGSSTKWANLYPEDGGVAGDGWNPHTDHSRQIAALDAAVERRLQGKHQNVQAARSAAATQTPAPRSSGSRAVAWVAVSAVVIGAIWFFNSASRPSPSSTSQAQSESCADWPSAAVKTTRADHWEEPTASEFMDAFGKRCNQEYWIWVDWQSIWHDATQSGPEDCSYWTQFRFEPKAIELARQDGSCT